MEYLHPDIAQLLPSQSLRKMHSLIEARSNAFAVVRSAQGELEEAWENRARASQAFQNARERRHYSGLQADEVSALKAPLDLAEAAVEAASARLDRARASWQATDMVDEIRSWLGEQRRAGRKFKAATPVKPLSGDPRKAVDQARTRLGDIDAEIQRVEAAPRTLAEIKAAAISELEQLAERGRIDADPRIRGGSPLKLAGSLAVKGEIDQTQSTINTLVFLLQEPLRAAVTALLPKQELPGALSDAARKAELNRLAAERLSTERAEEAAIVAAEAQGMTIARRRDASGLAVLEIEEI